MNYIHVYLNTDEDRLLPRGSRWIEEDSVAAYAQQIEYALAESFPGAEVDVTTYAHKLVVDTDVPGVDSEVVRAIAEEVWGRFDWLATEPDGSGRWGFHVIADGLPVGDFTGYATLADAILTAREMYEVDAQPLEIWLGGEVVATYPEVASQ